MRLVAEDLTMQDLKGVVADAKTEAARDGHRSGLKHGALLALLLVMIVAALCYGAGLVRFGVPVPKPELGAPHGTGPVGVVPPLPPDAGTSPGGAAPPLPGLPPGAVATPPPPASTPAVPLPQSAN